MATEKQKELAEERGRTDAIRGIYNNISDPTGFGIIKSNDPILHEKYRQGYIAQKKQQEK